MLLTFDDDGSCFRVRLEGDVRWNDRLALSGLSPALLGTRASRFLLDGARAREADRGAFDGVAATARRMALVAGLLPDVLPPLPVAAAA